jgi:arylsulfatase A-like enzyme
MKFIPISTLLLALAQLSLMPASHATESPNFVVILTDDQSWVGSSLQIIPEDERSKSDYYRTPNIERLAAMGAQFTQGYAPASSCCPTRRGIQIGQTPARHIYQKDQRTWTTRYREQLSIPQMLKQANPDYRAAHFGKWDMRFDNVTPEELGYDVSDGHTKNGVGGGKGSGGPAAVEDPKLIWSLTERASEFMEAQSKAGNPFYLQVSHYAVHLDVYYREETLKQTAAWNRGKKHNMPEFAAMTSDMDRGIGLLLDKIESLGLRDNTYIFFMSDNGGRTRIPRQKGRKQARNYPLRDGKHSVYEGGIRVPFIVAGPGIDGLAVSRVPVTGLDIFPTLAELAGYAEPLPDVLDGGSMTQVLFNGGRGEVQRNRPYLLFHKAVGKPAQTALIQGDYKLVKTWAENRVELFDISRDIGETEDLSAKMPDKTAQLHTAMVDFLTELKAETRRTGTSKEAELNAEPLGDG